MYLQPLRWLASSVVVAYYCSAYRIRGWGKLPRDPGPRLLIANHQHEIESAVIISLLNLKGLIWRHPIFTVSSRRMWEPGFLAERIPWMSPFLRTANLGWLFSSLGMQPIENELHVRPFVSVAYTLAQQGDLPIDAVFSESARARLGPSIATLKDILAPRNFGIARSRVKLTEVGEPYRKQILAFTRTQLDSDLAHFETLQRSGATIFLAPEGDYSGDGKMQRLRGALPRLAPLAQIWLCGISYDPFVGRRLSMLYRVLRSATSDPLDIQLKRTRPVTVSALLSYWLWVDPERPFTAREARDAVRTSLEGLPRELFVDPALRMHPAATVDRALEGMRRLGVVLREGDRYRLTSTRRHPQFPRTHDIVEYQRNFHVETLEGAEWTTTDRT